MAINVADNFSYKGVKPLDKRIQYDTVNAMVSTPLADLYDGCLAYVIATKKNYQYDSNNTVDQTLGKWREFKTGGDEYTGDRGIDITNHAVSLIPTESGDMEEIVYELPTGGAIKAMGFTPIGTIISVFGETAPKNYLICDGTAYNKADYPELAYHLLHLTTHSQYEVDGDDTKFKVPDLRGEFLRGTGTNGHTNQGSGANVGVHQNATAFPNIYYDAGSKNIATPNVKSSGYSDITSRDTSYTTDDKTGTGRYTSLSGTWSGSTADIQYITSRPTNTSVLYCIAVRDIYTNPMNDYSTSEKVVGSWIDGKPLYQKTVTGTLEENNSWYSVTHNATNVENVIDFTGLAKKPNDDEWFRFNYFADANGGYILATISRQKIWLHNDSGKKNYTYAITFTYTKTTD